ncbi:MAG: hypothetical protein KC636_17470 [Myxococcales bacterium]|nr:hypothetical protein [Myxococcales bacterium]
MTASTLQLATRAWRLRDLDLSAHDLWSEAPRWALTGRLEGDAAVDLQIRGGLSLACERPMAPTDLQGAAWSVDDVALGEQRALIVDDHRLACLRLEDAPLSVSVELGDAEVALLAITGRCALVHERVDDLEEYRREVEPFALRGQVTIARMSTGFGRLVASLWPPGSERARLQQLVDLRARCLADWPLVDVTSYAYVTGHEGASSGHVATIAAAGRPAALWESLARMRCRHALLVEPGRAPARVWAEDVEPLVAAGSIGGAYTSLSRADAVARVAWIRDILHRQFGRPARNQALTLTIDGGARLVGAAAHARAWPVSGDMLEALALRDAWNDKLLLVRTTEVDALLSWATGA